MPTNLTGRFTFIAIVVLLALVGLPRFPGIFSLSTLFDSSVPFAQKLNLKPGIDMAGGTSLLYEVQVPDSAPDKEGVINEVMTILKRRVDPEGVRNLVWRPLGTNRLEIQIPLTVKNENAEAARDAYSAARDALDKLNVRVGRLEAVVNNTTISDADREARLAEMAAGNPERAAAFGELVDIRRQRAAAAEAGDFRKDAELEIAEEKVLARVTATNVAISALDNALQQEGADREKALEAFKAASAGWDERAQALNAYIATYDAFAQVRDSLDDAAQLKRLLHGSGVLEFFIMLQPTPEQIAELSEKGPVTSDVDQTAWYEVAKPEEFGRGAFSYGSKSYVLLSTAPDKSMKHDGGTRQWSLQRASVSMVAKDFKTQREVSFTFDPYGGALFANLTRPNVGQPLAIVLDGRVISAPSLNTAIEGGQGTISGGGQNGFTAEEAGYLATTLNAGSLPAKLSDAPIMERTVGPQLGADNLRTGMLACATGIILVGVFLTGYYYLAGFVAYIAVLTNMVLLLGIMAAFNATFTLPGVAGIVLTIGMAVDANVLIFERLREEQLRGLSLKQAMRNAYDKAMSSIVDANVTTAITTVVLYWFGTEEVRGFGLTLGIGIICSLFTSLFVTKTIFALMIDRGGLKSLGSLPLTFPKWNKVLNPDIDWMKKAPLFITASAVFIAIGLSIFVVQFVRGEVLDVEFRSGTAVSFELKDPLPQAEVRRLIEEESARSPQALPSPSVISLGSNNRDYEVASPNDVAADVKAAVTRAMQGRLNILPPVSFDRSDRPFESVQAEGLLVPIESLTQRVTGFVPETIADHLGGVAIVLRNLQPALSAEDITRRIEEFRLSSQGIALGASYLRYDVETDPADPSHAVVLMSEPSRTYGAGVDRWSRELAVPAWRTVVDSLTSDADLQRVSNSGPQVAGETSRDALVAILISIVGIMFYIWVRFGDLRFGTATVIGLIHDTLFVLAAIGYSHLLGKTFIGEWLLVEPFRINLTMVAAILTVIGFSMNDTVVVFDRIRENRGKLGVLDRQVINDSINQTLSRTLLTSGTTIITVFVMYVFGGVGIHGFTFALLIGILCATYSSIAVSAPFLLFRGSGKNAIAVEPVTKLQQVGG